MATRTLVVDDDLQILPLVQRGLAYEGFEVYITVDVHCSIKNLTQRLALPKPFP